MAQFPGNQVQSHSHCHFSIIYEKWKIFDFRKMFESGENDGENREYEKMQESNVLKSADRLQTLQKENDLDEIYGYS